MRLFLRSTKVSLASLIDFSNSGLLRRISSIVSFQYKTSSLIELNLEGLRERLPSLTSLQIELKRYVLIYQLK